MVTGGSCGARPPSCSVVRVAPARRCGFAGAGPAAVARIAPPFPLRGGRPPGPGGAEGRACGSPAVVGAGGGGWGGRLLARPRVCAGGGGLGGALWPPGDASRRPWGGGGRGRHGGPGTGGQPSARGSRPSPAPPIESWMPAQALAGALTSPAVAARRRPAGGGRGG